MRLIHFIKYLFIRIGLLFNIRTLGFKRGMFIPIKSINGLGVLITGYLGYKYIFYAEDPPNYLTIILSVIWVIIIGTFVNKSTDSLDETSKELCLRGYRFALPRKYYHNTDVYSRIKPYFIGFHEIDFLNSKKNINELIESYKHCLEVTKNEKSYGYGFERQDLIKYQIEFLEKIKTIADRN